MTIEGASQGFPPIADASARVLILGTLPGKESLRRNEYYAKAQNVFWRLMGDFFGAGPDLPYRDRTRLLVSKGIAVWDVCKAAHRPGSLDSAIDRKSMQANDFNDFLERHRGVRLIAFNGATAHKLFVEKVAGQLSEAHRAIRREPLPSTSPAHASMTYEAKRAAWQVAADTVAAR